MRTQEVPFSVLLGKTIIGLDLEGPQYKQVVKITTADGDTYQMYHKQECCESVWIEDIIGDLSDLLNTPITLAEMVTETNPQPTDEYGTYTFYKLATVKGYVTIRWNGESNGCYSEEATFAQLT